MTDQQQPQTKRRQGCLFYGCLGGLVILLAVIVAGLIGLHYAKKMYYQFTDSQPAAFPGVKLSQPELEALRHRVDDFSESVKAGRHTRPLTLTGDEINALMVGEKDLQGLKGKFYVSLENDQVKAQLSMPLSDLNLPIFKGRYLNGSATLSVVLRDGRLYLIPQEITVKGKPIPGVYSQSIRQQNLARDMDNDPKASDALKHIQSIEVTNSELIIVPKEGSK